MKNIVKVAVMEGMEQALPTAVQTFQESMDEALKRHMSHEAFIAKAVQSALLQEIVECLQCIICKETSIPPIIVTSCCESVIGCHQCTKAWLDSGKTTCPKCREEGFNSATITMRGFNDFLTKMH